MGQNRDFSPAKMQVCSCLTISNHPDPRLSPSPDTRKVLSRPEIALGVESKTNLPVPTSLNHSFVPSSTADGVKAHSSVTLPYMPSPLASESPIPLLSGLNRLSEALPPPPGMPSLWLWAASSCRGPSNRADPDALCFLCSVVWPYPLSTTFSLSTYAWPRAAGLL